MIPGLAGFCMGLIIAALGAGGSLFIVPILLYLLHQPVHVATGTSLAVVGAAALVGTIGHFRKGNLDLHSALLFGAASMAAAPAGAWMHRFVSERATLISFAGLLFAASARMLFGAAPPPSKSQRPDALRVLPLGLLLGLLTGFLGVGGGFIIVPVLCWGAKLPLRLAIGTSLAVIAMTSATGIIGHWMQGNVNVGLLVSCGTGAMLGAIVGARLSGKLPERPIRYAFATMAAALGVYMLVRSV